MPSGAAAFYETSALTRINVEEMFCDVVRWLCARGDGDAARAEAMKELAKVSGAAGLLPWNWSKKAEYALPIRVYCECTRMHDLRSAKVWRCADCAKTQPSSGGTRRSSVWRSLRLSTPPPRQQWS